MIPALCSVAIDGPSGAGKSTIAHGAAERLQFLYVDTGAIYRTVGLAAFRAGVEPTDAAVMGALLPDLSIELDYTDHGVQRMLLDGEDVTDKIRQPHISMVTSAVSAIPAVRAFLLDMQRELAKKTSVIMDGRDIGTVVLPDAGLKIFLTASVETRARRRFLELQEKHVPCTLEEVMEDIKNRDENDSRRAAAPLKPADDALFVDTTYMTLQESTDFICRLIQVRFGL